jgi:MraZ protein
MSHFLGSFTNRIDAKGRVSVPAPFRAALRGLAPEGTPPLILRASHNNACIEGWPRAEFDMLEVQMRQMQVFSEEQDDLSLVLYSDAYIVESDKEGRIVLAQDLMQHAGLSDTVIFMGAGRNFQIWEPGAAASRVALARERALSRRLTLPGMPAAARPPA